MKNWSPCELTDRVNATVMRVAELETQLQNADDVHDSEVTRLIRERDMWETRWKNVTEVQHYDAQRQRAVAAESALAVAQKRISELEEAIRNGRGYHGTTCVIGSSEADALLKKV